MTNLNKTSSLICSLIVLTRQFGLVVDIGCGTGNVTVNMKKQLDCKELVAFDISPDMVKFAAQMHQEVNVRYEVASASLPWQDLSQSLSISDCSVDLVVSAYCFHWIPDGEKQQAINNVYTMLKPGKYIKHYSHHLCTDILWLFKQERLVTL